MTSAEYRKFAGKKRAKYRNTPTVVDGRRFDSKLEAKRYGELKALQAAGAVSWFIRQAPFRLSGGIIYRADFLVVWRHAQTMRSVEVQKVPCFFDSLGPDFVTVEDCKGVMTRVSQMKIKQVQEIYGITVQIIKKVR